MQSIKSSASAHPSLAAADLRKADAFCFVFVQYCGKIIRFD